MSVNPYTTNFTPNPILVEYASDVVAKPTKEPHLLISTDPLRDAISLSEASYVLLGDAQFVGPKQSKYLALDAAKDIGAEIVVFHTKYAGNHQEFETVQRFAPVSAIPDYYGNNIAYSDYDPSQAPIELSTVQNMKAALLIMKSMMVFGQTGQRLF